VIDSLSTQFRVPGEEGFETNREIVGTFGNGGNSSPIVPVVTLPAGTTVDSPGVRRELRAALAKLERGLPGSRIASFASTGERDFVSKDGRTTFALVSIREDDDLGEQGIQQSERAQALLAGTAVAGAEFQVTGLDALLGEEEESGTGVLIEVLAAGLGALLVLAFVFASLLAFVPLLIALFAIPTTFLLLWPLTAVTDVFAVVQFLIALIGLGVAIDYALLIVVRWREERQQGVPNEVAVERAMASAGTAVVLSGTTVAIGLLSMIALPVPFIRSLAYGGMLIPLVAVAVAITLLPVLLASAGPRIDWPRIRREERASRAWTAIARLIVRRRWLAAGVALAILGALLIPATSIQLGTPRAESLSASGQARAGLDALVGAGIGPGVLTPFDALVRGADPAAVADDLGALDEVRGAVAPVTWRAGEKALVSVFPTVDGNSEAGRAVLDRVRSAARSRPGEVTVGGQAAQTADFVDATYRNLPLMLSFILLLTFVLLARAFRSLLLPLKAVLLNLLSVGAAWGTMVLVWQEGYGSEAIWGIEASGAITEWVPLMVFAFLFGLSMDYEVFILSRIREEYDRTGSTNEGVVRGVGRTGRLVSSAALILFLAFLSLSSTADLETKIFATALAAGILLDATVVRGLLVPAAVSLLGRWNWWLPEWAARLLRVRPSPAVAEPVRDD
jgi:RND superfamily putative drug exporter